MNRSENVNKENLKKLAWGAAAVVAGVALVAVIVRLFPNTLARASSMIPPVDRVAAGS